MNIIGIVGGLVLAAFYIGAALYMGVRLFKWFAYMFPRISKAAFIAVFIVLAALALVSLVPMAFSVMLGYGIRMIGGYLTGFFMYLFMFFVLADVAVAVFKKISRPICIKTIRFYAGAAAVFLALLVTAYGVYNAAQITIVTHELQLRRCPGGEINIVVISDLHLGEVHSERGLERLAAYINGLSPDIVCIVGDIFNDDFYAIRNPERASRLLGSIDATFGVFACLGNHDTGPTIGSMMNFLEETGIVLLNDEHVIIDNRLVLIGRLDGLYPWMYGGVLGGMRRGDFDDIMYRVQADLLYRGLPADLPVVVMDHNPAHINEYGCGVDLALFGHSHGGGLFPITLVTRAMYVIDRGHFQRDDYSPHIVVTQGVHGWSIPMRVGSRNEIVRITAR